MLFLPRNASVVASVVRRPHHSSWSKTAVHFLSSHGRCRLAPRLAPRRKEFQCGPRFRLVVGRRCPVPLRLPRPLFFKSLTENVPRNRRSGSQPGNCQLLRVVDIMVSHPKLSKRAHRTKYSPRPHTLICRRANINLALVRHSAALRLVEQFWCFDFQSCRDIGNKPLNMKANDSSREPHVLTAWL